MSLNVIVLLYYCGTVPVEMSSYKCVTNLNIDTCHVGVLDGLTNEYKWLIRKTSILSVETRSLSVLLHFTSSKLSTGPSSNSNDQIVCIYTIPFNSHAVELKGIGSEKKSNSSSSIQKYILIVFSEKQLQ